MDNTVSISMVKLIPNQELPFNHLDVMAAIMNDSNLPMKLFFHNVDRGRWTVEPTDIQEFGAKSFSVESVDSIVPECIVKWTIGDAIVEVLFGPGHKKDYLKASITCISPGAFIVEVNCSDAEIPISVFTIR